MAIKSIKLFSIPVSDQAIAQDFYVKKLGFELKTDRIMDEERRWVEVGPKGAETSITLITWFPTIPSGKTKGVVIESSDIEVDYRKIKGRGVKFDSEIQNQPWGKYATLKDPDGNGLILQQSTQLAFA